MTSLCRAGDAWRRPYSNLKKCAMLELFRRGGSYMSSGESLPCISSPEEFAEMVKAALKSHGEERALRYEAVRFALIVENESGEPQQLFGLAAMFDEYNTAP